MAMPDDLRMWWASPPGYVGSDPRDEGYAGSRQGALDDWEWRNGWATWPLRGAKGFGAGLVNPLWMLAKPASERAKALKGELDRWQDEAPVASTMGNLTMPGFGIGRMLSEGEHAAQFVPAVVYPGSPFFSHIWDAFHDRNRDIEQKSRDYGAAGY
jgi:hypothetical protein